MPPCVLKKQPIRHFSLTRVTTTQDQPPVQLSPNWYTAWDKVKLIMNVVPELLTSDCPPQKLVPRKGSNYFWAAGSGAGDGWPRCNAEAFPPRRPLAPPKALMASRLIMPKIVIVGKDADFSAQSATGLAVTLGLLRKHEVGCTLVLGGGMGSRGWRDG